MSSPIFITATVHPGLLEKSDRLFTNDDDSIFNELIQNARRAGATRIEVTIDENRSQATSCRVTVQDNGRGIGDFQDLLALGESKWSGDTPAREDPAGMGFFSLCRSGVEVHSGQQFVKISPEVFLGKAKAEVKYREKVVAGTRITFTRQSSKQTLAAALQRSGEFCPVSVLLGGIPIPQRDFLEGALYRERIDGIEVGFATTFANEFHWHTDLNWNFYGARLYQTLDVFPGYLAPGSLSPVALRIRCNVFETARVKLQLPDRRAIIKDEFFEAFERKVRSAGYRFLKTQPRHALPFKNWKDAQELGVSLPEAAFLLTTWRAEPHDVDIERLFGYGQSRLLSDVTSVMLVPVGIECAHTFEGALESGATFEATLYRENVAFAGYSWYDKLPNIVDVAVFLDDVAYGEWSKSVRERPERIEVEVAIQQVDLETRRVRLPAFVHVDSDNGLSFVAVRNGPWDNERLEGPFSITDFLMMATFQPSDDWGEADSWQTQHDNYQEDVERAVNEYFRGPRATLIAILRKAIEWEANRLASSLGITEIHFKREGSTDWDLEFITAASPAAETSQPS